MRLLLCKFINYTLDAAQRTRWVKVNEDSLQIVSDRKTPIHMCTTRQMAFTISAKIHAKRDVPATKRDRIQTVSTKLLN